MSPRGVPRLGSLPGTVLGTITDPRIIDPTPRESTNMFVDAQAGTVTLTEPPPPWELDGGDKPLSDARRYVDVPDNWVLRWINPRLLEQFGWRYWQPVMKSDPNVKVKVESMVSPEGNIRRGGHTGDILAWMYRSWVEQRRAEQQRDTAQLTASAVNKQEQLKEEFARGKYGPNVRIDSATHPRNTQADGQEMRARHD